MQPANESIVTRSKISSEKRTTKRIANQLLHWCWVQRAVLLSLVAYTAIVIVATVPTWDVYMWWGHYMLFPVVQVYEICKLWSAQGFGHVPWSPDFCFGYGYPY